MIQNGMGYDYTCHEITVQIICHSIVCPLHMIPCFKNIFQVPYCIVESKEPGARLAKYLHLARSLSYIFDI